MRLSMNDPPTVTASCDRAQFYIEITRLGEEMLCPLDNLTHGLGALACMQAPAKKRGECWNIVSGQPGWDR
jgi:hypothetical protein